MGRRLLPAPASLRTARSGLAGGRVPALGLARTPRAALPIAAVAARRLLPRRALPLTGWRGRNLGAALLSRRCRGRALGGRLRSLGPRAAAAPAAGADPRRVLRRLRRWLPVVTGIIGVVGQTDPP